MSQRKRFNWLDRRGAASSREEKDTETSHVGQYSSYRNRAICRYLMPIESLAPFFLPVSRAARSLRQPLHDYVRKVGEEAIDFCLREQEFHQLVRRGYRFWKVIRPQRVGVDKQIRGVRMSHEVADLIVWVEDAADRGPDAIDDFCQLRESGWSAHGFKITASDSRFASPEEHDETSLPTDFVAETLYFVKLEALQKTGICLGSVAIFFEDR